MSEPSPRRARWARPTEPFLLARAPVRALVRRILLARSPTRKLSERAQRLLQAGAEAYAAQIFGVSHAILTHHADHSVRQTLRVPTFQLAARLIQLSAASA